MIGVISQMMGTIVYTATITQFYYSAGYVYSTAIGNGDAMSITALQYFGGNYYFWASVSNIPLDSNGPGGSNVWNVGTGNGQLRFVISVTRQGVQLATAQIDAVT